jgi:hypothetical protein
MVALEKIEQDARSFALEYRPSTQRQRPPGQHLCHPERSPDFTGLPVAGCQLNSNVPRSADLNALIH